ncbi:MAG: tRNA 2-thiouridine(34) synthase MnmA [Candidatus Aminicenantes bacterium]|nr:tRNA 2-thiouridine(34) synthase MnmA [Candidatus Aminicenantes bacterium]
MPVKNGGGSPVTVAFSGGKDSTAAILLLREQGYEVRALTMRLGLTNEDEKLAKIETLARALSVPWQVSDLRNVFKKKVLRYFLDAYRTGLTPNPCVVCNRQVKFGLLLAEAEKNSHGGLFASGHYADKVCLEGPEGPRGGPFRSPTRGGRWFLKEPIDRRKSQIYFLAMIEPTVLEKVIFPIAALTISQVRAKVAGLPLANPDESQDVCFLQGENLGAYLSRHLPESFKAGDIVDRCGNRIGRHQGAIHFTVGQRRGTGHASDRRLYVVGRDLAANTVMLGDEKDLLSRSLTVKTPVFWRPLEVGEKVTVKVRYQLHGHEARISEASPALIRAVFKEPVRAVTPGQFAVFYDNDIIVAAGEIS